MNKKLLGKVPSVEVRLVTFVVNSMIGENSLIDSKNSLLGNIPLTGKKEGAMVLFTNSVEFYLTTVLQI